MCYLYGYEMYCSAETSRKFPGNVLKILGKVISIHFVDNNW